jgi:hypothetical protein
VFASEEDVFFPARAVLPWVREIFPNLVHARCLKGASHVPSKATLADVTDDIRTLLARPDGA